ncbi:hypothetical protein [Peribacillus deserti]|nr:hypothetical protein [Peribacillus deserti]
MENKSLRAVIVLGINKGHGSNHETRILEKASLAWQELAADFHQQTGIYVSAVAHKSKTIYHTEWGCPEGGEDTITFTSSVNYEYVKDINAWKDTLIQLTKQLKARFEQETVTIEFEDISLIYLD